VRSDYARVTNPARIREIVGESAIGTADHVDRAVRRARDAGPAWAAAGAAARARMLTDAVPELRASVYDRAVLLTSEQGKVLWESLADASGPASIIEYFCALAEEFDSPEILNDHRGNIVLRRRPMGVTAVIVPWNYPIYLAFQHIIPALITGNTVVVKPSALAPLSLCATLGLLATTLPPGVLNVVPGTGSIVGSALARHPLVRKVLFTGSTATGRSILHAGADTIKSIGLELGGNDPAVILEDCTFTDSMIRELVRGVYTGSGQICFNIKRIYVPESRCKELVESFASAVDQIVVGDGMDERSSMGPVNNRAQFDMINRLIARSEADGGTVTTLGHKLSPESWHEGYFILPSIVTHLDPQHEMVTSEQFGPVVPIISYTTEEEVVALSNDSEFGLAASVWSDDVDHAMDLAAGLEAGSVFVNVHRMGASDMTMPFGGVKQSGLGRTHGIAVLEECTQQQVIAHRMDTHKFPGPQLLEALR
jgi:aldehyde dehydrogenase